MKKVLIVLLAISLGTAALAAQEEGSEAQEGGGVQKGSGGGALNAVKIDFGQLMRSFALSGSSGRNDFNFDISTIAFAAEYERAIVQNYSIGGRIDVASMTQKSSPDDIKSFIFALTFIGRWYAFAPLEKLFLGTGIGFERMSLDAGTPEDSWIGLTLDVHIGWKQFIGSMFFFEPFAGYKISKVGGILTEHFDLPPTGYLGNWYASLSLGVRF